MDFNTLALIGLALFATGATVGYVTAYCIHLRKENERMKKQQPTRLPYITNDEIENAFAALNKIEFDMNFKQEMVANAKAHLAKARNPSRKA